MKRSLDVRWKRVLERPPEAEVGRSNRLGRANIS